MGDKLYKAFVELIRKVIPNMSVLCEVISVDEANYTCECKPIDGGPSYHDVRIKAIVDGAAGLILIPKVKSTVIISAVQNNDNYRYISKYSEISKVLIECDNAMKIEINKTTGEVHLNGNTYGGLVKVQECANKIASLEQVVNSILTALKTTSIPLAPSGTYAFAPLYASINLITPVTTKNDLENTKVKHG